MKEKAISKLSFFVNSALFFIVGLTIIFFKSNYLNSIHLLISNLLIILGFITLFFNIIKSKRPRDILLSITTFTTGIFFLNNKAKFLSIFPIIFGIYMLINGIVKFASYIVFKNYEKTSYYKVLISSLIDFCFSYVMISHPSKNIDRLTIILGLYLILFGITYFYDFLKECFPSFFGKKRRFRVTLPIILATFIPYEVLLSINKVINSWKTPVKVSNKDTSGEVDLEILIHVRKNDSIGRMGHADLCYKGRVYSYGCYDEESKRILGSCGNGTLFEIKNKDKYIKYCNNNSDKTIFSFGITLTSNERKKVEEKLRIIKKETYKWDPLYSNSIKNSYAIELVEKTKAQFYKFNKGSYKTYFLFSTNCVKLVDDVLGVTGSDILKINGVITPGTYYNYLDKEFKRKNSNVISKEIYSKTK
ncbi:MAG: DUF308 domain-containing protein [Bacilli bacterium]|nr:DUF308 domain-containing protein [Bacilli bacterium]